MDLSLVSGAVGALSTAINIGKAAVEIHDANKLTEVVVAMNEQLLRAQQSLFVHNSELLTLQQKHFETAQELREIKETLGQRGSYSLFEITSGNFAYRVNHRPVAGGAVDEALAEPSHYICQPCFDGPSKTRAVLMQTDREEFSYRSWTCPVCKTITTDVAGGLSPSTTGRY